MAKEQLVLQASLLEGKKKKRGSLTLGSDYVRFSFNGNIMYNYAIDWTETEYQIKTEKIPSFLFFKFNQDVLYVASENETNIPPFVLKTGNRELVSSYLLNAKRKATDEKEKQITENEGTVEKPVAQDNAPREEIEPQEASVEDEQDISASDEHISAEEPESKIQIEQKENVSFEETSGDDSTGSVEEIHDKEKIDVEKNSQDFSGLVSKEEAEISQQDTLSAEIVKEKESSVGSKFESSKKHGDILNGKKESDGYHQISLFEWEAFKDSEAERELREDHPEEHKNAISPHQDTFREIARRELEALKEEEKNRNQKLEETGSEKQESIIPPSDEHSQTDDNQKEIHEKHYDVSADDAELATEPAGDAEPASEPVSEKENYQDLMEENEKSDSSQTSPFTVIEQEKPEKENGDLYEETTRQEEQEKEKTVSTVEWDMQVRETDKKNIRSIFDKYPLLGSKILSSGLTERINSDTHKYIDHILEHPSFVLPIAGKMEIALSVINYAKNWKSEQDAAFWSYITGQLGYRDSSGSVVRILQDAIESSLKETGRLFIEESKGRGFKSSVLVHSFSTRKSWMSVFDFLFDFYTNNLNWNYAPDDPIVETMVLALQKKLSGKKSQDEFAVSSHSYSFQEGVRKLILLRPKYSCVLFDRLLGVMDRLVNSRQVSISAYEEMLCVEWYREKVAGIVSHQKAKKGNDRQVKQAAVSDYARVRARFVMDKDVSIKITLPEIRLKSDSSDKVIIKIFSGENIAYEGVLSWYGNEMGRTTNAFLIDLKDLHVNGLTDYFSLRVRVICGETIYDSQETLYRNSFAFTELKEVPAAQCMKGTYVIFMSRDNEVNIENGVITEIPECQYDELKAYYVRLDKGFMLTLNGKLTCYDTSSGNEISIMLPKETSAFPYFSYQDERCSFAYKDSSMGLMVGDIARYKKLMILRNGRQVNITPAVEDGMEVCITRIPIFPDADDSSRIRILDMESEKLLFDTRFILAKDMECRFDREFYYSEDDFANAELYFRFDDVEDTISFTKDDEEIQVPFHEGILHVPVPVIRLVEYEGTWIGEQRAAWYIKQIPQSSVLQVINPEGTSVSFSVCGNEYGCDRKGRVMTGNILHSITSDHGRFIPFILKVKGRDHTQDYVIAQISYSERFLREPRIWEKDGTLFWDKGGEYIGEKNQSFILEIWTREENRTSLTLDGTAEQITIPDGIEPGEYQYSVAIMTGSLFKKSKKVLAEGSVLIGDENELRFKDRTLVLESITDGLREKQGHIIIWPCYIDNLSYIGMRDTIDGRCPVYEGTLSRKGIDSSKKEFSFEKTVDQKGRRLYKVNPVHVFYINESTLLVTDGDDDGLYYYHYWDRRAGIEVSRITDLSYTASTRDNYGNPDFYTYRKEWADNV